MGNIYYGVQSKARRIKAIYYGVSGIARKVKKVYVGVDDVARLVWDASNFETPVNVSKTEDSKE